MNWLSLHRLDDDAEILVNLDRVTAIIAIRSGGAELLADETSHFVKESPAQILTKLNPP